MPRDDVDAAFTGLIPPSFPGSTPPIRHDAPRPVDAADWHDMGAVWNTAQGEEIELFPIGALRLATGMGYSTLRKWETLGYLPLPLYHTPAPAAGKGRAGAMHTAKRRLYTQAQIELVCRGIEVFKITVRNRADWKGFTRFLLLGWRG